MLPSGRGGEKECSLMMGKEEGVLLTLCTQGKWGHLPEVPRSSADPEGTRKYEQGRRAGEALLFGEQNLFSVHLDLELAQGVKGPGA